MSRYRGPRLKKLRRLGVSLGLIRYKPGFRIYLDSVKSKKTQRKRWQQYRMRLEEKQKLRLHYGLTERQLVRYMRIAGKGKGSTGQVLLQLLEMRLDNILFRLGMAPTIPAARQLVNHRHILVNDYIVDIPSYRCKPGNIIRTKDNKRSKDLIQKSLAENSVNKGGTSALYQTSLDERGKAVPSYERRKGVPNHLTIIDSRNGKARVNQIIDREEVGLQINEFLVVEYYSRQI